MKTSRNKFKKHSVTKNCFDLSLFESLSSDLKNFANSWPAVSNFKSFSKSLKYFFLTVGQNNFIKIPLFFLSHLECELVTECKTMIERQCKEEIEQVTEQICEDVIETVCTYPINFQLAPKGQIMSECIS